MFSTNKKDLFLYSPRRWWWWGTFSNWQKPNSNFQFRIFNGTINRHTAQLMWPMVQRTFKIEFIFTHLPCACLYCSHLMDYKHDHSIWLYRSTKWLFNYPLQFQFTFKHTSLIKMDKVKTFFFFFWSFSWITVISWKRANTKER